MIGKLSGILDSFGKDHAILDVNGVGYIVFLSGRTMGGLQQGNSATFLIETHIREDHFHLYGFETLQEKELFNILLGVQGVGAKLALAIISAFSTEQLSQAIVAQDKALLGKIPGVGPKLAGRLVTELKDKLADNIETIHSSAPATGSAIESGEKSIRQDAISALANLGIARVDAFAAVNKVANDDMKLEDIISSALKEVSS